MATLAEATRVTGVEVFDHLVRDAEVPVITDVAAQGDVVIIRVDDPPAATPIPAAGYPVVRSENGGHTHSLHGDGYYHPALTGLDEDTDARLALGTLTVPAGRAVYLMHPEHGALQIASGTYQLRRQREWAGAWRAVAD